MKKLLILSLIAIFLFSFVACDEKVEIPETGTEQEGQTPTPPGGDQGGEETPPSGDQGGEVTPPSGDQSGEVTPPSGDQGGEVTPPSGDQGGEVTPPSGDQGGEVTPPSGDQGGEETHPSGDQGGEVTPPGGDQGGEVTPPSGDQGGEETPPSGDQGGEVTPPSSDQGGEETPPSGDQGGEVTPPSGDQGDEETPPSGDQGDEETPPSGDQGGEVTPPSGDQGGEVTPPSGDQGGEVTPPSGDQGGEETPPSGDQGGEVTPPSGDQGGEVTPPSGDQGGEVTPPSGDQGGEVTPPSGDQGGEVTPPSGDQGGEETPPSGDQGGEVTPPSGDQGDEETPPSGDQGGEVTPPSGDQGDEETPPSGDQGDEETPPSGDQGGEVTPPSGDQGGEVTPPSGDQGGEVTPPGGGEEEVTPPSGGETSDLIRGVDESLYSTVWKGTSDSGLGYLLIFDDEGRLSISVDYGSYYFILPLLEDIEEFANLQFPSLIYYQNGENPDIFPSDNTVLEEFTKPNSLSSRFSISTDTFNLDYDIEVSKIDDSLSVNSSGIFTTLEDSTQYSLLMARLTDFFEFPIFTDQVFEKITLDNFIYGTYSIVDEEKAIFRAELKELVIPSQMIVVATETFHDLPLLENIIISEGVSELKSYSIYALPRVKTVEIPASVEYIGPGCFCQCPSLTSINVSEDNLSYKSIDGVLYSKDGYTLVAYPEGKGANITIKDGIETIGASSFQDNLTITELTIPTSVISIEPYAFMYTSNLEIINYDGTMQEWNDIIKGEDWNWQSTFTVKCTDGNIDYQNEEIQE